MFGDVFKLHFIVLIIVVLESEDVSSKSAKPTKNSGPAKKAMPSIPPKVKVKPTPPVFSVSTQSAKKPKVPGPVKKAMPSIPPKTKIPSTTPLLEAAAIPSIPPKTKIASKPPVFKEAAIPSIPPKTETPSTSSVFEEAAIPSIPPKTEIASTSSVFEEAAIPSIPPKTVIASTPPVFEEAAIPSIPPKTEIASTSSVFEEAPIPSIPSKTEIASTPPVFEEAPIPSIPPKTEIASTPPVFEEAAIPSIPPKTEIASTPPVFDVAEAIQSIPPKIEIASQPPIFDEAAAIPSTPPKTEISSTSSVFEASVRRSSPPNPAIQNHPPGFAAIIISIPPKVTTVSSKPPETTVLEMEQEATGSDQPGMGTTVRTSGDQMTPFLEPLLDSAQGDAALFESAHVSDSVGGSSSNTVAESGSANSQIARTSFTDPTYEDMKALYQFLLESYDTRVRPKLNQSHTTQVSVFFSILNILDFNIATQTFDILGYFYFVWEDEFLTWRPRKFSRLRWIKIPKPEIWTPQLIIANMYSGESKIGDPTDRVLVTYKGKVSWVPEATYKIVCEVEIEFYPFDRQTCKLTFHVSDDTISEVELFTDQKHNGIRTDHYIENSEWKLIKASVEKYDINGVSYMDVIFIVERRLEFIFFTIVAPLLLLSVLNLCAFLIPVESEEKGDYSVTIVITYGVFISHITGSLPPNSMTIPYFLLYMIWLLGFSVSTVIYSIIQSRLYSHYGKRKISLKPLTVCFGKKMKPSDEEAYEMEEKSTIKVVSNIEHVTDKERRSLLCGDMLKKLDVIMIILYILSITGTTLYFFFSMNVSNIF